MFRREGDKEIPEPFADEVRHMQWYLLVRLLFNP